MLVLTRKLGEAVCIGRDVEVFVVGVSRGKVKLGFRAPRDVSVQRAEIASPAVPAAQSTTPENAVLVRSNRDQFSLAPPLRFLRIAGER